MTQWIKTIGVENAVTWGNLQSRLEKHKKTHPEKNCYIFNKISHPKQIVYTFLKNIFIPHGQTQVKYNKKFFTLS